MAPTADATKRTQVCKRTYQCSIRHVHLVTTHTLTYQYCLYPQKSLSCSESLCAIGSKAVLRPPEVADDVVPPKRARTEGLSGVDSART